MNKNVIIKYSNAFKELLFENNVAEDEVRSIIEKYCSELESPFMNSTWNFTIPFTSRYGKDYSIHGDINFYDFVFYTDIKLLGILFKRKDL